jgi:hypothetical protein
VIESSLATFQQVGQTLGLVEIWLFIKVLNIQTSNSVRRPFTMSVKLPIAM